MSIPNDAPPSYDAAVSKNNSSEVDPTHLHVARNGIPPLSRRSMEDEARELPEGWVRQFDDKEHHQFFVDTTVDPPRSIWSHPYDDETYMKSLSSEERQRVRGLHRIPTEADLRVESSDEDEPGHHHSNDYASGTLPPRPQPQPKGIHKFGRKMKDKMTNSTHEERETERRHRAEEEEKAYKLHQHIRQAMSKAIQTGQPQLIGKDKDGKDVYVEPPMMQNHYPGMYGGGYGGGYNAGYGMGSAADPYRTGVYSTPNARYVRPPGAYSRPYGSGYGGGMGLPLAAGLGGGMLFGGILGAGIF